MPWARGKPRRREEIDLTFALLRRARGLLRYRGLYTLALAAVALGLFAGISVWLVFASQEAGQPGATRNGPGESVEPSLQLTLTQLVARQVSSATSRVEVQAATAELLESGKGFHLEQVEVSMTGAAGEVAPGLLSGATGPAFFRADEGWLDSGEGNLLLDGDIYGRRESDDLELAARRLEYEPAADEIRLFDVRLRRGEFEKTDAFLITDARLERLRSGTGGVQPSEHPFFQRYGGGKGDED